MPQYSWYKFRHFSDIKAPASITAILKFWHLDLYHKNIISKQINLAATNPQSRRLTKVKQRLKKNHSQKKEKNIRNELITESMEEKNKNINLLQQHIKTVPYDTRCISIIQRRNQIGLMASKIDQQWQILRLA